MALHSKDMVTEGIAPAEDKNPERQLACAVIERAILDARCGAGDQRAGNATRDSESRKARLFLTAESGQWARMRNMWLDMAGIDPDAFKRGLPRALAVPIKDLYARTLTNRGMDNSVDKARLWYERRKERAAGAEA